MRNKFRLKKKLVSMALALLLAAQPLASFPMNVFAGTGSSGMTTATSTKTEKVTVPVSTTISVSLPTTTIKFTSDITIEGSDFSEDVNGTSTAEKSGTCTLDVSPITVPFPVTTPVKLGETLISSPGNVIVELNQTGTVTFVVTGTVDKPTSITNTVEFPGTIYVTDVQTSSNIQIASGNFTFNGHITFANDGTSTTTDTITDQITFTDTSTGTGNITFNSPSTGTVTGDISFTGNLRIPCELMVPADVTATVTDDKIDIQATASPPSGGVG